MLVLHLLAEKLSENVIKLLLSDKAISLRVYAPNRKAYLLHSVILQVHIYEFIQRQVNSLFDIFVNAMAMEVAKVPSQIGLQLLVCILKLYIIIDVI